MILQAIPNFMLVLPEIVLAIGVFTILMCGVFLKTKTNRLAFFLARAFVVVAIAALISGSHAKQIHTFNGQWVSDYYNFLLQFLILTSALFVLWVSSKSSINDRLEAFEYPALIMMSVIGGLICSGANDLLITFVGLELMTLPLFIMMAMNKKHTAAPEAALKYFTIGAIASCLFLFGVSFIYGYTGTTNFNTIHNLLESTQDANTYIPLIGVSLIIVSLALKVAAAPVHMWAPDVYQGTPLTVTLFFASIPKLVIISVLILLMSIPFIRMAPLVSPLFLTLSGLSLVLGAMAALKQTNFRRLVAYASTVNMGFVFLVMSSGTQMGFRAALYFIVFYSISTILLFATLLQFSNRGHEIHTIDDLKGMGRIHPFTALVLAFTLLSMAGIPPFPGFIPKLSVLFSAFHHNMTYMPLLAVLVTVISAAYYLKILKNLFFLDPENINVPSRALKVELVQKMILLALMGILVGLVVFPKFLIAATTKATAILLYL